MGRREVFVDTSGFLALWDAGDEYHSRAVRLQSDLLTKSRSFLTSDYILDETATLLLVRHSHGAAVDFLQTVSKSNSLSIAWTDSERFEVASAIFCRHEDKKWSFTDCVSFALMREMGVTEGFTTDHHFRQAGLSALLLP